MSSSQSILLKGGTLLIHDENNHVVPTRADLLVEGNTIARIEGDIPPAGATRVIDCTSKVISPGFISTHAHLWETQLKGLHPNHTLIEYLPSGCYAGTFYTVQDLFWGQLAGAMESVDAGTTTVVDHSHLNLGPDYPKTAIQALSTSGLRSIYCYTPPRRVASFNPLRLEEDCTAPAVLDEFAGLASSSTSSSNNNNYYGDGRVSLGFAMDSLFLGPAVLRDYYARLRDPKARAKVITSHAVGGAGFGGRPYAVAALEKAGVLGPDVILSHAPCLAEEDVHILRKAGAFVSSTPNTEMQMGMEPVSTWRSISLGESQSQSQSQGGSGSGGGGGGGGGSGNGGIGSLGVDCHTWGTSYMPTQMNLILQQRRLVRGLELGRQGKWPRHVEGTAEEVFNLATVAGARAVGMEGEIGRLKVKNRADLVIFDGTSPGMMGAAAQDPVAAVVLHSSIRDVDMVLIDGVVRKEGGKLCDVKVGDALEGLREQSVSAGTSLSWDEVARETLRSREVLRGKTENVAFGPAEEAIIDMWHMDRLAMVER